MGQNSLKQAAIFHIGKKRRLNGMQLKIFITLASFLSIFQVWSVIWGKLDSLNQMAIHLSFILMLTFFYYSFSAKKWLKPSLIDYSAICLSASAGVYFTIRASWIATRIPTIDPLTSLDLCFGIVLVVLTIEAARRTIGFPIVLIIVIGLGYTLFGHYFTGLWYHRAISISEMINDLAYSFDGLWGSPIAVAASFVFMFLLFGAFLQRAGAGEFFFQLSQALAGNTKGGPAKVAVLASALFGSISGSPTANVVTTGAFTIPVSKRTGYKASFAAAVEAAASTGGSILPPIMGSSTFLMAAVTQLSYASIMIAAIIPGILYYVSLLAMVHFEAERINLSPSKHERGTSIKGILKSGWYYFIPLIVLVYFLMAGYSASRTGFYGILSIVIVSWFRKDTRMGVTKIFQSFVDGAKSAIPVSTACAAAGLVIAGIMSTGLGGKLTSIVLGLTNGMFIPTLLLVMIICIIFGMGMPVAAAYILTAMLAAPALISLGVPVMAAHLFIVYFSIFSAITPPVAVAAFAAAGIADANPNKVGFLAVRLGLVGFIVPFMFVLNPSLLLMGDNGFMIISIVSAFVGVIVLAGGIIGWLRLKAGLMERIGLLISGILLILPSYLFGVIGAGLVFIIYIKQSRRKIRQSKQVKNNPVPRHESLQF